MADPSPSPHRTIRIDSRDLVPGMFVAELDRPWLETPFLFQGFVIQSAEELAMLRQYCDAVVVDLDLSEPAATDGLRPADGAGPSPAQPQRRVLPADTAAPWTEALAARADAAVSRETRERFHELLQARGLAEPDAGDDSMARRALLRLRALLRTEPDSPSRTGRPPLRMSGLPADIRLLHWNDAHDAAREMPRARQALARAEAAIGAALQDAATDRIPASTPIVSAAGLLADSMTANPDALLWVCRLREEDPQASAQVLRVALLMIALGRQIGLPLDWLRTLGTIGLLADLGKARLARRLLDKPGLLAPAEYAQVKHHVQLGVALISQMQGLPEIVRDGVAQHHERLDGSGYPAALAGDRIGLAGRIAGIADSFAALSAPRAYANPVAPQEALMALYQGAGTLFDGWLLEQFIVATGVFPVGSLVELASGELAVVVALERTGPPEPRLLLVTRSDKRPLAEPVALAVPAERRGPAHRIANGLPHGAYGLRIRDYYAERG